MVYIYIKLTCEISIVSQDYYMHVHTVIEIHISGCIVTLIPTTPVIAVLGYIYIYVCIQR